MLWNTQSDCMHIHIAVYRAVAVVVVVNIFLSAAALWCIYIKRVLVHRSREAYRQNPNVCICIWFVICLFIFFFFFFLPFFFVLFCFEFGLMCVYACIIFWFLSLFIVRCHCECKCKVDLMVDGAYTHTHIHMVNVFFWCVCVCVGAIARPSFSIESFFVWRVLLVRNHFHLFRSIVYCLLFSDFVFLFPFVTILFISFFSLNGLSFMCIRLIIIVSNLWSSSVDFLPDHHSNRHTHTLTCSKHLTKADNSTSAMVITWTILFRRIYYSKKQNKKCMR